MDLNKLIGEHIQYASSVMISLPSKQKVRRLKIDKILKNNDKKNEI